uniref:TIR domain-containing protein n=1 Tax=Strigamia maritima TaxID=126957 RepID=T1IWY7_STRMM
MEKATFKQKNGDDLFEMCSDSLPLTDEGIIYVTYNYKEKVPVAKSVLTDISRLIFTDFLDFDNQIFLISITRFSRFQKSTESDFSNPISATWISNTMTQNASTSDHRKRENQRQRRNLKVWKTIFSPRNENIRFSKLLKTIVAPSNSIKYRPTDIIFGFLHANLKKITSPIDTILLKLTELKTEPHLQNISSISIGGANYVDNSVITVHKKGGKINEKKNFQPDKDDKNATCSNNDDSVDEAECEQPKNFDIFVSYRRATGKDLASLLKVYLEELKHLDGKRNYTVFLDVRNLESGLFDEQLLEVIKNAPIFILLLTPNSLDRCFNDVEENDWIHKGPKWDHENQTGSIEQLEKYIRDALQKLTQQKTEEEQFKRVAVAGKNLKVGKDAIISGSASAIFEDVLKAGEDLDKTPNPKRRTPLNLSSLLKEKLEKLKQRKYSLFLDVADRSTGPFDERLYKVIENSPIFILVLSPNALDRCFGDTQCNEWIHKEVACALKNGCTIIPVMHDNFKFPKGSEYNSLPKIIQTALGYNGIPWHHDDQEGSIKGLDAMIQDGLKRSGIL